MRRKRNAKIIATVGPASNSPEMLKALFDAGIDVFRLNFSHGSHDMHAATHKALRDLEKQVKRPIGILVDLQGPKLRVGKFADGGFELKSGQNFRLDLDDVAGDETRVQLPHPEIFEAMEVGSHLLVNDGKVRLKVLSCDSSYAHTEVVVGGEISDNKGVNVPDVYLPISPLTPKDRKDLDFALSLGSDWVALSFVQRAKDMEEAREIVGDRAALMAKLEKPSAIQHSKSRFSKSVFSKLAAKRANRWWLPLRCSNR